MAIIRVKFRPSTAVGHEGSVFYEIYHEKEVRQFASEYRLFPSEWDKKRSTVMTTHKSERESYILSIKESIRRDMERLKKIILRFEADRICYTALDVIDGFKRYTKEYTLFNYMDSIIDKLKLDGKVRTSETYMATLSSFRKFRDNEDILLDCLTSQIMESYEAWLQRRSVTPNTISFYTRILRAVYNRAVEDNIIENHKPFRRVYTGVDKTVKRALPLSVIKKIRSLDLSQNPYLDYARDMFMMSFMLRGMSFIDMAYLRKSDFANGHIVYRRRKTGQLLAIKWTKEMQHILDKYPGNSTDYLLPIITKPEKDARQAYLRASYSINHQLKKIGGMIGISIPLTLYVARHSWASAAKTKGIPISVISEGMGHDNETTTQIYLASLDNSVIDKANSLILRSI